MLGEGYYDFHYLCYFRVNVLPLVCSVDEIFAIKTIPAAHIHSYAQHSSGLMTFIRGIKTFLLPREAIGRNRHRYVVNDRGISHLSDV